jgi:hypothetical protein
MQERYAARGEQHIRPVHERLTASNEKLFAIQSLKQVIF